MTIRLYDSMARKKVDFAPADPANLRMYVCGPTVYDRAHIGNARPVVVFDVLFRLLRHVYGADHVKYVRNVTDIDDKIMARAAERGVPIETVTSETYRWFQEDMGALGCLPPTHQPRATDHVGGMIAMIERLIAEGAAYPAEGHVLFEVAKFPGYGRLSGRSVDDMIAGARVEVAPWKRDPMDFVLWKPSADDQPGWDSPWGRGRPGWHIECSVMARALLGADFDIHGGGADLTFPHHENEIAQSCCAHPGEGFARHWMHNGMVLVNGRKMSKSLGNFLTVQDMRDQAPGEVLRLALLMTHYRDPLDWTDSRVAEARKALEKWSRELQKPVSFYSDLAPDAFLAPGFVEAIEDDLNVPQAMAALFACTKKADPDNRLRLKRSLALLGFENVDEFALQRQVDTQVAIGGLIMNDPAAGDRIDALLTARAEARAAKDFARADAIRKGLDAAGVVVMDRPGAASEWELRADFDAAKLEGIEA
jgi:cysteinyl-tRNA synthetase